MRKYVKTGVPALIVFTLVMAGCSTGNEEASMEMDTPQINYIDEGDSLDVEVEATEGEEVSEDEGVTETIERELFLFDQNGLIVPQTIEIPKQEGVLRQSLEYLVEGGPVTNHLPNGFRAVLPAGTEVDVHLEDGIAYADFSEEFKNYKPEEELKILQAITWTVTQFENVNSVKIRINGYDQETMPVNQTPIGMEGFSRANGINLETNDVFDVVNSKGVTLYFLAENGDNTYYVPVTRRVEKNEADPIEHVVSELLEGPSMNSSLLTDFRQEVELLDSPLYENGVVTLNFNEALLNQLEGTAISDDVLNMLVLSLTEQNGVEKVSIQVNGNSEILTTSGDMLAEPVSRQQLLEAGKF
ncbi:GerMN domain-containing protein [Alkalihalobacterium bogoriense]|uniref:GerMN domain-containing protein n=1 Tax=Alkalihalobacterium bogoriense TaxID=246272 RepID=UPI00047C823D|nr:GerMN domain-containing protein [Alkalihalobacterium bogoriense]